MKNSMKLVIIFGLFILIMFSGYYYFKNHAENNNLNLLEQEVTSIDNNNLKNICTDLYIKKPFVKREATGIATIAVAEKDDDEKVKNIQEMEKMSPKELTLKVKDLVLAIVEKNKNRTDIYWSKYFVENYISKYVPEEYKRAEMNMSQKDRIEVYLSKEFQRVYSKYYEILSLDMGMYSESENNKGEKESVFVYTMTYKNFDKDPDTVGYIKEAKEKGDINYKKLKEEYLEPKKNNYVFKVIVNKSEEFTLFTQDMLNNEEEKWVEVKIEDFIVQ